MDFREGSGKVHESKVTGLGKVHESQVTLVLQDLCFQDFAIFYLLTCIYI